MLAVEARDGAAVSAQLGSLDVLQPSAAAGSTAAVAAAAAAAASAAAAPSEMQAADQPALGALRVPPEPLRDPGASAWDEVPRDRVQALCGLDPNALDRSDRSLNASIRLEIVVAARVVTHQPGSGARFMYMSSSTSLSLSGAAGSAPTPMPKMCSMRTSAML
jgi:hypothetical protein